MARRPGTLLPALCAVLLLCGGCEALQRKFTRKPKHPAKRPEPITRFQDYSSGVAPQDLYKKHYLLFQYWDAQLVEEMQRPSFNMKRIRNASREVVKELDELRDLLAAEPRARFDEIVEARRKVDRQLQAERLHGMQREGIRRVIESQARQIHREFSAKKTEQSLVTSLAGEGQAALAPQQETAEEPAPEAAREAAPETAEEASSAAGQGAEPAS